MTIDELLEGVKGRGWGVNPLTGAIRCKQGLCPVAAMAEAMGLVVVQGREGAREANSSWRELGERLGMGEEDVVNVVGAADGSFMLKYADVRGRMVKGVGGGGGRGRGWSRWGGVRIIHVEGAPRKGRQWRCDDDL